MAIAAAIPLSPISYVRPPGEHGFEVRFETPPGEQAQVDFAQFHVVFTMVSVGGNAYSVPDATRSRLVEVHSLADEVRIFENGELIAVHPVLERRKQRRVAPDTDEA